MKNVQRRVILFILATSIPNLADARKVGGGGGGFRGGGAARGNLAPSAGGGAGHPPMGGGGGFHPQPAPAGGFHGGGGAGSNNFRPPGGGGPGHFGAGSGPGSAKSGSAFKTALAGAALGTVGGLVAFEAGKAIIHSFDKPFQHDGRSYYWGDEYAKKRPGEISCSMPFEKLLNQSNPSNTAAASTAPNNTQSTPDQALAHATFPNGTRPKQIVWTCKANEDCCGTDCCPKQYSVSSSPNAHKESSSVLGTIGKVILIIIVVGFLLCCCCALIAYKFCRSLFDSCMPSNNNQPSADHDQSKYEAPANAGQAYPQQPQAQSYPMQPYPGSNNYPAQPQPPNAYPHAPAPGYYENKY